MGVFNPVFATYRLEHTEGRKTARVLTAWTITTRTAIAAAMALWGVLAGLTSARTAIATAGVLLLATTVLLPWRPRTPMATAGAPDRNVPNRASYPQELRQARPVGGPAARGGRTDRLAGELQPLPDDPRNQLDQLKPGPESPETLLRSAIQFLKATHDQGNSLISVN